MFLSVFRGNDRRRTVRLIQIGKLQSIHAYLHVCIYTHIHILTARAVFTMYNVCSTPNCLLGHVTHTHMLVPAHVKQSMVGQETCVIPGQLVHGEVCNPWTVDPWWGKRGVQFMESMAGKRHA